MEGKYTLIQHRPGFRRWGLFFTFLFFFLVLPIVGSFAQEPTAPVLFIPGILGSKLADNQGIVWGDLISSVRRFAELEFPHGPKGEQLRATGTLDDITVLGPFQIGQYRSLLDYLKEIGFKQDENLFLFPYDWRQSNFDSAEQLSKFVEQTPQLRDHKFNIVAHSMGGIVALIYLHRHGGAGRVNRLITLGTPYQGSLNAFRVLLEGLGSFKNFVVGGDALVKRVLFSFPSLYELLPRYDGCCILGAATLAKNQKKPISILNPQDWRRFKWFPDGLNDSPQGEAFNNSLSRVTELQELIKAPLPLGVRVFKVAGDLIDTLTRVYLDKNTGAPVQWDQVGGDGTVPVVSATAGDDTDAYSAIQIHGTIFNDDHVKVNLKRMLTVDKWLEKYAFTPTKAFVTVGPENKSVPLIGIEIVKDDTYLNLGQKCSIHVRLQGEQGQLVSGVNVQVRLRLTSGADEPLAVVENPTGDYRAPFTAPNSEGVYRFFVDVPGVGVFEDYFVALLPQKEQK